jgi:hypothetical protein
MQSLLLAALSLAGLCFESATSSRSAATPQSTPEEIAKLIKECGEHTTVMARRLFNYSFNQTDSDEVLDKSGRVKSSQSKTYEVYPIIFGRRARLIYVQVSENGVPLNPDQIAKQRERAAKETAEIEKQADASPPSPSAYKSPWWSYGIKVEKRRGLSHTYWYLRPTDFLLSSEFFAPRRVKLADRETILLNFRLRTGYVFDETNVAYPEGIADYGHAMSQLAGRIWIDATDKVIARLEASPTGEMASVQKSDMTDPNLALTWELNRLANGTWVLTEAHYNSYGREDVFWQTPIKRALKYADFKVFKTTADIEKTEPAASPTP